MSMAGDDQDRTVFAPGSLPGGSTPAPAGSPAPGAMPPPPPASSRAGVTGFQTMAPRTDGNRIQIGDVLNNIFEVRRFIARGGMGEVFEGVNVNTEERVAIKVMLPSLAADPAIQEMFRKEARILQKLAHPALVPYRVLAQEPQLGTFYIVTDYIDGANLADVIATLDPSPDDLARLLRRLAEGLRAAHALGAIHRDISPDNVLLEDGRLDRARIIDFGIAKDTDPGSKTIIGDGFAGKLSYVAPEQLGDFGREIGPWTDVYSLALVILAIARKGQTGLGGSFVEAIDRRRKGIDLADMPPLLQPVMAAMLRTDPAERLRSMDAVLDMLAAPVSAAPGLATPKPARMSPAGRKAKAEPASKLPRAAPPKSPIASRAALPAKYLVGGGVGAAVLAAVMGYVAFGGPSGHKPAGPVVAAGEVPKVVRRDAAEVMAAALPGIDCSWLTVEHQRTAPDGVTLAMSGVAGKPAEAQAAVGRAMAAAGLDLASADFSEVAPLDQSECSSVNAFRSIRALGARHITLPQNSFEMRRLTEGKYNGQIGAQTVFNLDLKNLSGDIAVYGLDTSGLISNVISDRAFLTDLVSKHPGAFDIGPGRYRFTVDANHTGWSGFLLLTGDGGFSDSFMVGTSEKRGPDWPARFEALAAQHHWTAEMVWLRTVDEVPN